MKRSGRQIARDRQDAARQYLAASRAERAKKEAEKDAAVQAALARSKNDELSAASLFDSLRWAISKKAPKLLEPEYRGAIDQVRFLSAVRDVHTWKPKGKGRDTLFRSLAEHLLAKYPTPAVLWNGFFDPPNARHLTPLIGHVAGGGSLFSYAKEFPIPLTRKMCHEVLKTPSDHGLLQAIRRAQVNAVGGDRSLFNTYWASRRAKEIGTKTEEAFRQTVLDWLAKNPMLDKVQVGPLLDYIEFKHQQDPNFSMKGRSALAMLRGMREWHGNLHITRNFKHVDYPKSGFKGASFGDYVRKEPDGSTVHETWSVEEILTSEGLRDEGRRMSHCVLSYSTSIETGRTSIWSILMEDGRGPTGRWAMLTVEVRNDTKQIVQARGRFNKLPDHRAHTVLLRWANMNGLTVQIGW